VSFTFDLHHMGFVLITYLYIMKKLQTPTYIRRNLVLCNHPICDYMQLNIICNYVLSFYN
jgi:hypothetical protein